MKTFCGSTCIRRGFVDNRNCRSTQIARLMTGHKTNATGGSSPLEESTMYEKVKALCPDGKIRTVYHDKADFFFSAPAYTRVRGKFVSGFVMKISMAHMPPAMVPESGLEFVPYSQYSHLVPDSIRTTKVLWYTKFFPKTPSRHKWIWEPSNQEGVTL